MKTGKTTHQMPNTIDSNPLNETNRQLIKFFSLPIWVAIAMSICLGSVTQTARAKERGVIMKGFVQDIEDLAVKNDEFRRVIYTAKHC